MVSVWANQSQSLGRLWDLLRTFAISNSYRHRIVFLSCYQTVLLITKDVGLVSDPFMKTLESLSYDPIVDVRIRLARFLGTLLGEHSRNHSFRSDTQMCLGRKLPWYS